MNFQKIKLTLVFSYGLSRVENVDLLDLEGIHS